MEGLGTIEDKSRLYNAALTGDTITLRDLLENDPLLVERVSFTCRNTPLHVATMAGNFPFIHEILNLNPQLAELFDSQQRSPLHIASAKGYLDIVKRLILAAPDMCLSGDYQGWNPLHLAAINGHVEVLAELIQAAPLVGKDKVGRGHTALHLCARDSHLEVLKLLVERVDGIVDARDEYGDTVLHIAVRDNQTETTQYLVENTRIDVNATNSMGKTVRDLLEQHPENIELARILKPRLAKPRPEKWLTKKKRDYIMVVAVIMATMAFRAAVNPPGGRWQHTLTHDAYGNPVANPHRAGEAIMAYRNSRLYKSFIHSNTITLVSSLSTILLLISGLPFRHRVFVWILMVITWLTVTSIAVTYAISITHYCFAS